MSQTVTVNLPSDVYVRIKHRADQSNRSVEDEASEILTATMASGDGAEITIKQTLLDLDLLDSVALQRAAQGHLSAEFAMELESLHLKQQREPLTEAEAKREAELIRVYEQAMLIRAQAAALLKKRGFSTDFSVSQP